MHIIKHWLLQGAFSASYWHTHSSSGSFVITLQRSLEKLAMETWRRCIGEKLETDILGLNWFASFQHNYGEFRYCVVLQQVKSSNCFHLGTKAHFKSILILWEEISAKGTNFNHTVKSTKMSLLGIKKIHIIEIYFQYIDQIREKLWYIKKTL